MKIFVGFLFLSIVGCSSIHKKECGVEELLSRVSCSEPNLEKIAQHPLGSKSNPIRSDGPQGQREYLSRLICTNNEPVSDFSRAGSVGESPWGFITDLYIVICDTDNGVIEHEVYMDLYHTGYKESGVANGFGGIKK